MTKNVSRETISVSDKITAYSYRHPCVGRDPHDYTRIKNQEIRIKSFSFLDSNLLILSSKLWIPACAGMTMVRGLQVRNGSPQHPKDCFTTTGKNVSRETSFVMKTQPLSRHHEEEQSSDVVIQS